MRTGKVECYSCGTRQWRNLCRVPDLHSAQSLRLGPTGAPFAECLLVWHSVKIPSLSSAIGLTRHRGCAWGHGSSFCRVPVVLALGKGAFFVECCPACSARKWHGGHGISLCRVLVGRALGKGSVTITWHRDDAVSLPSVGWTRQRI
jgi:hypothetical protein